MEVLASGTYGDNCLDFNQSAEVKRPAWNDGTCWAMRTKERRIGTICLVPMYDIGHVDGASDDVVDLRSDDATYGRDVCKRERHLVRDGDLVNIRGLAGHTELTGNIKSVAV